MKKMAIIESKHLVVDSWIRHLICEQHAMRAISHPEFFLAWLISLEGTHTYTQIKLAVCILQITLFGRFVFQQKEA